MDKLNKISEIVERSEDSSESGKEKSGKLAVNEVMEGSDIKKQGGYSSNKENCHYVLGYN